MEKIYKVRLLPSARNDLKDSRLWYRAINADLPKRFAFYVNESINNISLFPHAYAIRYKNIRIANVRIFPFAIHFFIDEDIDTVIVIAIHHSSINPEKWAERI